MKIVSMSTWGIRCGIAEYARSLNRALRDLGVDVEIWANVPSEKNPQDHRVLHDADFKVFRNWSVEGWSGQVMRPVLNVGDLTGLVHVQYESFLYSMVWFPVYLRQLRDMGQRIVVTYHSAGIPPQFPADCVDMAICHTQEIAQSCPGRERILLEMPAPYRKPVVGTFGLGRAHVPWIEQACKELDYEFLNMIHERGTWSEKDQLLDDLRECDVICLPYPPVGTSVSSSAVTDALSSYRPVIVSDTNWFSTIPPGVVCKHAWDYESFKLALAGALPAEPFLRRRSWQAAATSHKALYEKLLNTA